MSQSPVACLLVRVGAPHPFALCGVHGGLVFGRDWALHCRCYCCIRRGVFNRDQSDQDSRPVRDLIARCSCWGDRPEGTRAERLAKLEPACLPAAKCAGALRGHGFRWPPAAGTFSPPLPLSRHQPPWPPSVLWPPRTHSHRPGSTLTAVSIKIPPGLAGNGVLPQ